MPDSVPRRLVIRDGAAYKLWLEADPVDDKTVDLVSEHSNAKHETIRTRLILYRTDMQNIRDWLDSYLRAWRRHKIL